VGKPAPRLHANFGEMPGGAAPADARGAEGAAPIADAETFLRLIERETPVLLKVTSALVGFADAEDAAQEAVMKAWQARASLRDQAALRPWLLRIAVNICREWQRGRFGRWQRVLRPLDGDLVALPAREDAQPGAIAHAEALDVREAINALHASLRLVVTLRYYAGLDASEIGAALGLPPPTVRTRLRRALSLLRDELGESGYVRRVARREGGGHAG